jgi:serine/threonine-protein kinase
MNQVCAGLKAAHQGVMLWQDGVQSSEPIQIVHRDLKPENIFLVPTTLGELVKILDFGIAKISSTATEATNTGIFMGTFQYAAPEQLEARKNLDKRADIYSLGMILYEMLSGVDPFTGVGEPLSGMSWVRAHISQSPLPLRSQPSCKQLSPALEAVVMRCLEKEPSDRYNSVDELRIALQNAVGHMFDGPTIVSPSPHIPVEPAILPTQKRPQVETSDRQNLAPASVAPPSVGIKLSKDIQQKLETALANQIGPIATVVLKREVSQSTNYPDLLTRLVQHLPVAQRDEFLTFANTLMGSVHPTMKTAITQMQQAGSGQIAKGTAQVVDPEFAKRCEQELAELIGPMARLIVQRHLKSQLSVQQFVEAIAQQIPDSQQAAKFRQRLLT